MENTIITEKLRAMEGVVSELRTAVFGKAGDNGLRMAAALMRKDVDGNYAEYKETTNRLEVRVVDMEVTLDRFLENNQKQRTAIWVAMIAACASVLGALVNAFT